MNKLPTLTVLLVVAMTFASGLLHGWTSNRWGQSEVVVDAGAKLADFPATFGPWQLQESRTLSEDVIQMFECSGYVHRAYIHTDTGQVVNVALLAGPSGPISLHDPEICYQSTGYKPETEREREEITLSDGSKHHFWGVSMKSGDVFSDVLQVYYGWNTGTAAAWDAVEQPRLTYATRPFLYKVQVAAYVDSRLTADSPCRQFLSDFLPVAEAYLVNASR
jgi:hypothetical protein